MARAALFFATMLVVSTLARSSFAASAPFCDDRGATALAAPPTLEAPDGAIQRTRAAACGLEADGNAWRAMLRPAHAESDGAPHDPSPARLTSELRASPVESMLLPAPEVPLVPSAGAIARVERPPRP